ncbi:MAG: hypothetical protein ACTHJX_14325 [Terriglobales bacterium]
MLRFSAVVLLACLGGSAAAVPLSPPTPPGGSVRALAADPAHPATVLLGTAHATLFRSTDAGSDWQFWSRIGDHDDWVVAALVADRTTPGHWFAALWSWSRPDGGVFVSNDDGRSWQPLWLGHAVRALAEAPSDPRILVAATLDGVFRSQDSGREWARISPAQDRELRNVESVAVDPRDPQEIYVGTWHLPWKTINGGHDWWQMRQGVIDDSDVFSITVDQNNPATLYLSACSGIYRSDNRGNLFRKIQGIPYTARRTPALVQDPGQPGTIYAGTTQGLWVSRDQGATWRRTTSPALRIEAVAVLPHTLLLGTDFAGMFVSHDGGLSFSAANHGFSSRQVAAAAASPAGTYLSVTGDLQWGGIFLHQSSGDWLQLPPLPHDAEANGLYWSQAGLVASTAAGVFVLPPAPAPQHWRVPAQPPAGPLYALSGRGPAELWAAGQQGLFHSHDGGLRWTRLRAAPAPLYRVLAAAAGDQGAWLFIAGDGYLLRSHDGGQTFLPGRLSLDGAVRGRIHQIAMVSVPHGRLLLAATTAGLYQSRDLGAHWELTGHGLPALDVRAVHAQPDGLYALAAAVGAVYRSRDGGERWQPIAWPPAAEALARSAPSWPAAWPAAGEQAALPDGRGGRRHDPN